MRRRHNNGGANNGSGRRSHGHKFSRPQGGDGDGQNRPRNLRNVAAARDKYMNMGRDALHAGDRVLAEYYFQHADHYFRILLEEGYSPNQQQRPQAAPQAGGQPVAEGENTAPAFAEEAEAPAASALPSFITSPVAVTAAPAASTEGNAE